MATPALPDSQEEQLSIVNVNFSPPLRGRKAEKGRSVAKEKKRGTPPLRGEKEE